MTVYESEIGVVKIYKSEIAKCELIDQVCKLYRQIRIWARWHLISKSCSYEDYLDLCSQFKKVKDAKIEELKNTL